MFGASIFLYFFFACQGVCKFHAKIKIMMKNTCFTKVLDPPNA